MFHNKTSEEGYELEMVCVFGHAEQLTEITWYRERPSGIPEKIITLNSKLQIKYRNWKFNGRIKVPGKLTSINNSRFNITLSDLDHNDISKYWCEVKPDLYNSTWRHMRLEVKGLNYRFLFLSYL